MAKSKSRGTNGPPPKAPTLRDFPRGGREVVGTLLTEFPNWSIERRTGAGTSDWRAQPVRR